jgi:hypothetical protein
MWIIPVLTLSILAWHGAMAQTTSQDSPWHLSLAGEGLHFSRAAVDTSVPPDLSASLRPTSRVGVQIGLDRAFGRWEAAISAGYAGGQVEIYNQSVRVVDRTAQITRYRLAASAGRALTEVGSGRLVAQAGPTVDLWTVDGDQRVKPGVEVGLALRLPLGRLELENRIRLGISGSPITQADIGHSGKSRSLRTLAFGVGLRVRL